MLLFGTQEITVAGMRFWVILGSKIILAGFLFGLVWWFYTGGSKAYEKEFDRTREALKSAKTWKFEQHRGDDPNFFQEGMLEADCSVGYHGTVHVHQGLGDFQAEVASIDKVMYQKVPDTGEWKRGGGAPIQDGIQLCEQFARGNAIYFFPDNKELDDHYVVTRKDTKQVNGIKCREWRIQRVGLRGMDNTVCIGVKDHLPYEVSSSQGPIVFNGWNQPLDFKWPEARTEGGQ